MQEQHTKHKDETTYTIKTYIESNPDGMFMNESDIAEFVQLYTKVQQTLPTVLFHWRVWEVKDDGKGMPIIFNPLWVSTTNTFHTPRADSKMNL